jgi:protein TonB
MFEQTFVQGAGELRKPWSMAASLTGQLLVVGIIGTVPFLQTARIAWTPQVILYASPRPAPPPLKVAVRANSQTAASVVRAVFQPRFAGPTHIPTKIVTVGGDDAPPVLPLNRMGETFGGQPFQIDTVIAQPKITTAPETAKPFKPSSLRTSTGVQQALLIYQLKPLYPPLAKAARISGTVRLAAVIARDGAIQHLQLISGPPLLTGAALDAVQKWRYKPTLLSGEPVEVITEIDVNFTLSN